MVNAAIIGVSGFGNTHYSDLIRYQQAGKLQISAAVIINQDVEAEKCATLRALGCKIYTDYQQMFKEQQGKLDLCFIPTGIGLHTPMAIAAMRAGANALIEKPAAPTIQDITTMQAVERETGKFVAVGFQSIYQPEIQRIKREVLAGKIGKIRCIKGVGLWPRDYHYYSRNSWAGKLKNGGWILDSPFNNALAHYLNLLCFFGGSTFEKSAELDWIEAGLFRGNPEIETTDTAILHLKNRQGVDILFYTTHCSQESYGPVLEVHGECGSIIWNAVETKFNYSDRQEVLQNCTALELRNHLMDALLNRLGNPEEFICGLDIAGTHVLAVNGAHESAPILPLPSEKLIINDGNYRYTCPGIDKLFKQLCLEEKLPDAAENMPMGERFLLQGYREFKGGKLI